jgi:hypothetical protein
MHSDLIPCRRAVFKWANGTVKQMIDLPGDETYVSMMLSILDHAERTGLDVLRDEALVSENAQQVFALSETQYSVRAENKAISLLPLETMMKNLEDKIALSLLRPVFILGITYPLFFEDAHRDFLNNALRNTDLDPVLSYHATTPPFAAAAANGIRLCACPANRRGCQQEKNDWEDPAMVLSIDFSGQAFSIQLYEDRWRENWRDGGIKYVARVPSGVDLLQESAFWAKIVKVLKTLVSQATGHEINYLVVSGSRVNDTRLHEAIQAGLGSHVSNIPLRELPHDRLRASITASSDVADPELAGAWGAAELSWRDSMRRSCMDPCPGRWLIPGCKRA